MDKVLYFPYISIPNTPWLTRTLLYWDKVGSIVPIEYVERPDLLGKHMLELVKEQLVEQIFPGQYTWQIPDFKRAFLDYVDKNLINKHSYGITRNEDVHKTVHIHMEKLDDIGEELIERNLAWKGKDSWYLVEAVTGMRFMTYLASILGVMTEYSPITDRYEYLAQLGSNDGVIKKETMQSVFNENLRIRVLNEIMPIPTFIEDVYEIIKFKEKYGKELSNFRNHIETFLLELEMMPNELAEERLRRFVLEAKERTSEIECRMKEFKWRSINFVTFCSVTSAVIPLAKAAYTKNTQEILESIPGIFAVVASAFSKEQLNTFKSNPFAYAAIAKGLPKANHLIRRR